MIRGIFWSYSHAFYAKNIEAFVYVQLEVLAAYFALK